MNHFRQPPTVLWHWGSMTADDDSGNQDAYDLNAPPLGGGQSQQFTSFCVAAEKCKNESNSRIGEKVKNGVASYAVPMQKQEQLHGKQNQQCSGLDQLYRQQRHPNRCEPDRAVIDKAVFPGNSVAAGKKADAPKGMARSNIVASCLTSFAELRLEGVFNRKQQSFSAERETQSESECVRPV